MAELGELLGAMSALCESLREAALNASIIFGVAFLVFAGLSFFAYKKYSASKANPWLAATLISSLISLLSLASAANEFINFINMGCP